jgi:hypothetical protein
VKQKKDKGNRNVEFRGRAFSQNEVLEYTEEVEV